MSGTIPTKATNAQRLALALKRHGVKYVFGQSNPPAITLACMDAGIPQIGYRQENAGSYMAMAFGMVDGSVPVVTAQNGPAATLLVPGLAEALKASHPMLAVVQEIPLGNFDKNAFQELDSDRLFAGVAKWVKRIVSVNRIEDDVDMAITMATSGRPGPVVLLCPADMFNDKTEYPISPYRTLSLGHTPLDRTVADPASIDAAAELLAKAKAPIVYAGGGVISSGACAELRALQDECSLPVATSTMGKSSVDEEAPLTIGPIGYYMGKRGATEFLKPMVQDADVILLVGNRTNQNGTDSWTLLPRTAKYIHIDVDPIEIGRNYEAAVRLCGDAKLTLAALKDAMKKKDLTLRKNNRAAVEKTIAEGRAKFVERASDVTKLDKSPFRVERFLAELDRQLADDAIIVADASVASVWLANYITAKKNRQFVFPRGLAGLGWGMPMAMGAKLAKPGQPVFCLVGDGGFAHVWSELETCKRHGIDIVVAVINNEILSYQKFVETVTFGRSTNACDLGPVNHVKVAEACGVKGITVSKVEDIAPALKEAFATKGTVVLDLMVEALSVPPVKVMEAMDNI